jgi:hypothetical protein
MFMREYDMSMREWDRAKGMDIELNGVLWKGVLRVGVLRVSRGRRDMGSCWIRGEEDRDMEWDMI